MFRKSKIEPVEKVKIVERYLAGEIGIQQAGKELGVDHHSIRNWISIYQYDGPTGLLNQPKNKSYSKDLKISAINDYLNGEGSLQDICTKYGIRSHRQLSDWIKVYNSGGILKTSTGGAYMKKAKNTTLDERLKIVKMIYKGIDEELMVIPCMNNKVLFLNMSNIEDITLSDFDADTPSGKNWDEHVSCGEIPLVVYEALEDYEENSQVTLYNDTENSTELYKYLMEYVRKNGWTEEDIFQLLNTSVFYYLDGRKKSTIIDFYQDSDDIIETIEMVYGYDFTDIEQNFMFYIDAHDETENFVNLKGISMMELPLLKVEEEIFRRNDQ